MRLKLEVISDNKSGASSPSRSFEATGGTIGRTPDNDWVLSDPSRFVSSKHAEIACRNGQFIIIDTSSNGIYLNDSEQPVGKGNQVTIQDGDIIIIGDYEIKARLEVQAAAPPPPKQDSLGLGASGLPGTSGEVDPLKILGGDSSASVAPAASVPSSNAPYVPPAVTDSNINLPPVPSAPPAAPAQPAAASNAFEIPEDWDQAESAAPAPPAAITPPPQEEAPTQPLANKPAVAKKPQKPRPAQRRNPNAKVSPAKAAAERVRQAQKAKAQAPESAPQPMAASSETSDRFSRFLQAMGIQEAEEQYSPEDFAQIMKTQTQGIMEALWARNEVRNQFRLAMTMIQQRGNNPLKFSTDADDAFYNIFVRPRKGDLDAITAFDEALIDLNTHQYALIAGMRAAFESMLKEFNPRLLEKRFGKKPKDKESWKDMIFKEDNWDRFCAHFETIAADKDQSFKRLFGEAFSAAYEQEIVVQKENRRTGSK